MSQPIIWMRKGHEVVKVSPKQQAAFAKLGYAPFTPEFRPTGAQLREEAEDVIRLKPEQRLMFRGTDHCIADPRQFRRLQDEGWSFEPPAPPAEPATPPADPPADPKGEAKTKEPETKSQGGGAKGK